MKTLDSHLQIRKSNILNAGDGVFTTIDIKKGQVITELKGSWMTYQQFKNIDEVKMLYCYYINRNNILDCQNKRKGNFGRFINDANGGSTDMINNTVFINVKDKKTKKYRVYVVATMDITKGSELLVDYGSEYWPIVNELKTDV